MIPPVVVMYTGPSSSACETARSAFPTTQRPGSAAAPEKEEVLVANASCSLRMFLLMPRRRPTRKMNKSALAQETSPGQRATRRTAVPKPLPLRSVLVSVMVPDPGQRTFWTILISSPGSQVEVLVGDILNGSILARCALEMIYTSLRSVSTSRSDFIRPND